jgi:hypothetical protein
MEKKHAQRMSRELATIPIWDLMPQIEKDFAGVRGRVRSAVEASPRSVTFAAAVKQARLFSAEASKMLSDRK